MKGTRVALRRPLSPASAAPDVSKSWPLFIQSLLFLCIIITNIILLLLLSNPRDAHEGFLTSVTCMFSMPRRPSVRNLTAFSPHFGMEQHLLRRTGLPPGCRGKEPSGGQGPERPTPLRRAKIHCDPESVALGDASGTLSRSGVGTPTSLFWKCKRDPRCATSSLGSPVPPLSRAPERVERITGCRAD